MSFATDLAYLENNKQRVRDEKRDESNLNSVCSLADMIKNLEFKKIKLLEDTRDMKKKWENNIRMAHERYETNYQLAKKDFDKQVERLEQERQRSTDWWNGQITSKVDTYEREAKDINKKIRRKQRKLDRLNNNIKTKKFKNLAQDELQEDNSDSDTETASTLSSQPSKITSVTKTSQSKDEQPLWKLQFKEYCAHRDSGGDISMYYVQQHWPELREQWRKEEREEEQERAKRPRERILDEEELKYQKQLEASALLQEKRKKQFEILETLLEKTKSERDSKFDKTKQEENKKNPEYNSYCDRIRDLNLRVAEGKANPKLDLF